MLASDYILADALGGEVTYHSKGEEHGNVDVQLTMEGKEDWLPGVLPSYFKAYVAHAQTVKKQPPGTIILAKNDFENHHVVCFRKQILGGNFIWK